MDGKLTPIRICLYSGPGAGKSRLAARLYGELTEFPVDLVSEYVKKWAYEGRKISGFDQIKIFGEQIVREELILKSGRSIITDSPIPLQLIYAQKYKVDCWPSLMEIAKDFDKKWPSVNIFLDRVGIPYDNTGRYESFNEALQLDRNIIDFLFSTYKCHFFKFNTLEYDQIRNFVSMSLRGM